MRKIAFLFPMMVLLLSSCSYYGKIGIGDVKMSGLKLESTTNAKITFTVSASNTSKHTISIIGLEGVLYRGENKFATISFLESTPIYPSLHEDVTICTQLSLIDPIALLSSGLNLSKFNPDEFLVDGEVTIKPDKGCKRKIKISRTPIMTLVKNLK